MIGFLRLLGCFFLVLTLLAFGQGVLSGIVTGFILMIIFTFVGKFLLYLFHDDKVSLDEFSHNLRKAGIPPAQEELPRTSRVISNSVEEQEPRLRTRILDTNGTEWDANQINPLTVRTENPRRESGSANADFADLGRLGPF